MQADQVGQLVRALEVLAIRRVDRQTKPRLLEFPHSHYCEKARWALEWKGVAYRRQALFPGLHLWRLRGLEDTSVPVLVDGTLTIQGSGEILDYLERRVPEAPLAPADDAQRDACAEWERYLDREVGVHIRRFCYFHLLERPDLVAYFFCYGQPAYWRPAFRAFYPVLRRRLVDVYDIRPAGAERSREALHEALERLARHLAGRRFFVGDVFSRADLCAASLLSFFAVPPEHPVAWPELGDDGRAMLEPFAAAPAIEWVRGLYRGYRPPPAKP